MPEPYQPLRGVTILAWEQAVSLPMATRLLADLGATVIRLDAPARAAQRPRHLANDLVRNKLSLALDLRQERGREVFRALVRRVDVLCENYTPRVKRGFGLNYDALRAERPDLIMLSLSGYGQTGPWSEKPTYGPGIEAASGHAQSMGYPDQPPTRPGTVVYADNVSGFYAAFAILSALHHRRATGEGRFIDLSMYEANAFHLLLPLARSSLSGLPQPRRGNGDERAALQGVYPALGEERWLAVTVRPEQTAALAALIGADGDGGNIEQALVDWLRGRSAEQAAAALQAAGIAAAPVLNARDVLLNEQLRSREAFTPVAHERPVNGYTAHPHDASPFRFAGHPRPELREAPAAGQDTRLVLGRWLGLTDAEVDGLLAAGVIGEPAGAARAIPAPTPEQVARRQGWRLIAGHDADPGRVLGLARQEEEGQEVRDVAGTRP